MLFNNMRILIIKNKEGTICKKFGKTLNGYEGDYKISNLGNVKSFKHNSKGKLLKRGIDKDGYYQYILCKNNIKKM